MAVIEFKRRASIKAETQNQDVKNMIQELKNRSQDWENHEPQDSLSVDDFEITLSYILIKKMISIQLEHIMETHDISKIQMAQRMGISADNLDRILNPQAEDDIALGAMAWCAKFLGHSLELKLH